MHDAYFRIISDVHGLQGNYLRRASKAKYSLQLGDLSVNKYDFLRRLNPDYHKVISGNHENFEKDSEWYFRKQPHFLGNYGVWGVPKFGDVFYLRGGFSRNLVEKIRNKTWSNEEQLDQVEFRKAFNLYEWMEPKLMVTHEAPRRMLEHILHPDDIDEESDTDTNVALDKMMDKHQPDVWVFGHYHKYVSKYLDGTHFIGLDKTPKNGSFIDFPENWEPKLS